MKNKAICFGIGILIIGGILWLYITKSNNNEVINSTKIILVSNIDSVKSKNKPKEETIKKLSEKGNKTNEKTPSQIQSDMMKEILKNSK